MKNVGMPEDHAYTVSARLDEVLPNNEAEQLKAEANQIRASTIHWANKEDIASLDNLSAHLGEENTGSGPAVLQKYLAAYYIKDMDTDPWDLSKIEAIAGWFRASDFFTSGRCSITLTVRQMVKEGSALARLCCGSHPLCERIFAHALKALPLDLLPSEANMLLMRVETSGWTL